MLQLLSILMLLAVFGIGCSAEAKRERALKRADGYFERGEYEKAAIEYMNALRIGGETARVMSRIGLAEFARGNMSVAFPALKRAVALDPEDTAAGLKLAAILLLAGENNEARKQTETILARDQNNFEALKLWSSLASNPEEVAEAFTRLKAAETTIQDKPRLQVLYGRLYQQQSNFIAAEQAFKAAQVLDPRSKDAHIILGDLYASRGETNLAGKEFEAATQAEPTNSLAQFRWAEFKWSTGELAESKKLLSEMVASNPEYLAGWYRLAGIAASEGDFREAEDKLATLLKRQSDYLPALALKARILLARGDTTNAVRELETLTERYPQNPEFNYLLAAGCQQKGELAKAIRAATKATAASTNYADAELLLAELRIRAGDAAAAIQPLEQLRARQPQLARVYVLLGSAYLAHRQVPQAVAAYQKLTELISGNEKSFYLLGLALLQEKEPAKAAAAFEKALSLNPRSFDALAQLVDLSLSAKDYQTALDRVKKQIEVLPASRELYLQLGRIQLAAGEVPQAESSYRKAIEIAPEQLAGYLMLSQILAATGKVGEAVRMIEEALAKKPDDATALTLAGSIYQNRAKDYGKARSAYEKVLATQPDSAAVLNNLASIYSEQLQDQAKAYEYAARAYKLAPENPAVMDTLGWIGMQRGDFRQALPLLKRSAGLMPNRPEIAYHLGMAQCNLAEEKAGGATLRRALSLSTNFPGADQAMQMLSVIAIEPDRASPNDRTLLEKAQNSQLVRSPALFRLALLAERQKEFDKARGALEQLLKDNADYFPGSERLARLLLDQDADLEKAHSLALKAREQAPESLPAAVTVARSAYRKGQSAWAQDVFRQIERTQSPDPVQQYRLAWAYYEAGLNDAARAAAGRALQLKADFTEEEEEEARLFLEMLNLDPSVDGGRGAKARAGAVLAKRPGFLPALMFMAALERREGAPEKAKAIYEGVLNEKSYFAPALRGYFMLQPPAKASDKDYALATSARKLLPDDPHVARALAIFVYERKDYGQAANLLTESNRKLEGTADSLFYLGMCHFRLGDRKAAKEELQSAIKLDPSLVNRESAGQVLAEIESSSK